VIAGISYSGYIARIYHDLFPENVLGIALIDSGHENQWKNLPAAKEMLEYGIADFKETFKKTHLGKIKKDEFKTNLPKEILPLYQEAMMEQKTQEAYISNLESIYISADQLGKTKKLGSLPLVVLSAGNSFGQFIEYNEKNKQLLEDLNKKWMELQFDLAALSTNSDHIISPNSKHDIVGNNPLLAAAVINFLIEKTRR
jgi:pimeloyl-ACP methyl ester carboxylesterase